MKQETIVGGQAVMEGVMMLNKLKVGIAVRNPKNKIITKKFNLKEPNKFYKLPFIRGVFNLFRMLGVGMKALNYSANVSLEEEEEEVKWWEMAFMIIVSVVFALAIFKFLPLLLANLINKNVQSNVFLNILDGIIKISFFVLYIYIISLFKDVKRVFQYHGAEHKVVHCVESKKKLTVQNAQKFSTIHPRCGTAFVLLVLTLSIIVYTFIPLNTTFLQKFGIRVLLLPVIAGISYELLRLNAKLKKNVILNLVIMPGLWLQRLTTKEPDNKQVEVAIKAMNLVLKK